MSYVYLIATVFLNASASVLGKYYNAKNVDEKDPTALYNFLQLISVFVGWGVLYAFDFSFDTRVLPYSVLFALSYTMYNVGIINALKYGPASLSSLFVSLSLIFVTVWGFIFWSAKITAIVVVGLVFVVASIFLCLFENKKDEKKFSLKWLLFVLLAFIGNAGCSIIQRTQQIDFDGEHGKMLMAFASLLSLAVFAVMMLVGKKSSNKTVLRRSWYFPVSAGLCNVALNFFVMLLALSELSPSLIYPTIGVGGLIVVILFSLFAFKEKLRVLQWVGVALGIAATVLLSL